MKSNNEEYLDSLLDSAQKSNSSNPKSALSRMSSGHASGSAGSGDISALVDNSGGNKDLQEIGSILNKLDGNELVDEGMDELLESIGRPTDPKIPKFTIGDDPANFDVRDMEEIALDEAIAAAENMESSMSNPIVDLEEGDDALLEMAPEVSLPEDNMVAVGKDGGSDADESPEEILTDLLDDMKDDSLTAAEESSVQDSLSDVLDNLQDETEQEAPEEAAQEEAPQEMPEMPAQEMADEMPEPAPTADSASIDELSIDDLSLDELEAAMDSAIGGEEAAMAGAEAASEDIGEMAPEMSLEDMAAELGMDELALEEGGADEGETPAEAEPVPGEPSEEPSNLPPGATATLDELNVDEINLDDMEASLDELLITEENNASAASTEGEIAAVEDSLEAAVEEARRSSGQAEEVSMEDLDALMDSLANDEIEDIESTAHKDEESGHADEAEIPKNDIIDALTEDGFDDMGMEPSLDELASIPERSKDSSGSKDGDEDSKGGKGKKEKKKGFFAKLIEALTQEDEEAESSEGLASLTDENQKVLAELGDDDGKPKAKKKKEKKEKKPKDKKPKKEKPAKEKKPPKPKKEKKPKPPKDPGVPEKVISPRKIALSGIFAASLGILILIPALVMPDKIASEKATTAYTHREYTTAYKMLYGKEMSEDESIIYEQSRVLAWAQRYLDGYENYTAMNMKEEALDMLLMAMRNQEDLLSEAAKYSVEIEVNSVYDSIESLLSESYGLSAADIAEINSIKKDRDYTIRLMEIVGTL